ncbi:MAG: sulfite exporter TauE/SafE family protein [Lutibacter sp.]|uniref:sulfite exporter TauE/SafE family protein n=1 Tax=Lutibacter sp. TaxID=1925666 RepID=UPI0017B2328E|nr:sulfite exporter TauE/SafE family protein [Lutibacter sp.]MBT8316077.1 sulfite exporter TauE/SafE family protein [Lutibacter sp.]NNJ56936.1 sulfite exporter TauE/SafE family protein [Lutibacter sp.]
MDIALEVLGLIVIGFVAGSINTIAGGGSLLTLPILIFLGLPPSVANGTNRIAILFQNIFTTAGFKSKGIITFPFSIYVGISALVGSLIGSQIAVDIKGETFNKILAMIMVIIVFYMVFKPKNTIGNIIERTSGKHLWLSIILFFFVGIYGGFIQAGVGFIILLVLSSVNNLSLVKSNAVKVTVVLIYIIGSVLVFAYNNKIDWQMGLTLAIGNAAGGWFASRWSVNKGDQLVRKFLIVMVIILAIKLWFY